ncbi:hypothetical protein EDC01DRAFT_630043 [Geopyxis carbonaria]|nr:hypothetical protein EDC01DRAFT_630043 [Geopyxis carbonaria]
MGRRSNQNNFNGGNSQNGGGGNGGNSRGNNNNGGGGGGGNWGNGGNGGNSRGHNGGRGGGQGQGRGNFQNQNGGGGFNQSNNGGGQGFNFANPNHNFNQNNNNNNNNGGGQGQGSPGHQGGYKGKNFNPAFAHNNGGNNNHGSPPSGPSNYKGRNFNPAFAHNNNNNNPANASPPVQVVAQTLYTPDGIPVPVAIPQPVPAPPPQPTLESALHTTLALLARNALATSPPPPADCPHLTCLPSPDTPMPDAPDAPQLALYTAPAEVCAQFQAANEASVRLLGPLWEPPAGAQVWGNAAMWYTVSGLITEMERYMELSTRCAVYVGHLQLRVQELGGQVPVPTGGPEDGVPFVWPFQSQPDGCF